MRGDDVDAPPSLKYRTPMLIRCDESGRMAVMKKAKTLFALSSSLFACLVVLGVVTGAGSVWLCCLCSFILMLQVALRWHRSENFREVLTTMKDSQTVSDAKFP